LLWRAWCRRLGRAAIVVGPDDDAIAQRFFPFLALDELPAAASGVAESSNFAGAVVVQLFVDRGPVLEALVMGLWAMRKSMSIGACGPWPVDCRPVNSKPRRHAG